MKTHSERDLSLDILRSLAVLYIVGYWHLQEYTPALNFFNDHNRLITNIVLALFFYISGYLLSRRYTFTGVSDLLPFFRKRIVRVYPMYIGTLVIFAVIHLISPGAVLRASLLTNMVAGENLITLWFVCLLIHFYLMTPLFLYRFSPPRVIAYSAGIVAILVAINSGTGYIDLRFAQYLPAFATGLIVARVHAVEDLLKNRVLLFFSLIPLVGGFLAYSRFDGQYPRLFVSIFTFTAALGILLYIGRLFGRFCSSRVIGFFSYSSFAVYLLHRISFAVGKKFFRPEELGPSLLYLVGLILPLTVISAYLIQKSYDRLIVERISGRD